MTYGFIYGMVALAAHIVDQSGNDIVDESGNTITE